MPTMKVGPKTWIVVALCSIAVALSWVTCLLLLPRLYGAPKDVGTFGDMFGSVNALFTGLALVGVATTIWLQRLELRRQDDAHRASEMRSEEQLRMTREQLEIARQELKLEQERIAREAEPLLVFTYSSSNGSIFVFKVVNHGGPIKHVRVSSGWVTALSLEPHEFIGQGQQAHLSLTNPANPAELELEYVRVGDGVASRDRFVMDPVQRSVTMKKSG